MKSRIKKTLLHRGGYSQARGLGLRVERARISAISELASSGRPIPLPDSIIFEPTLRCNLRCEMCYQDRRSLSQVEELSTEQILGFFDDVPYLKKASLNGGEIFLRRDITSIIEHLDRTRDLVISTNGTLITPQMRAVLASCQRLYAISISVDGPADVHDGIRRVPGAHDRTAETVRDLALTCPVTVNTVIQSRNIELLPGLVDSCADLAVKKLKLELERITAETAIRELVEKADLPTTQLTAISAHPVRDYPLSDLEGALQAAVKRARQRGVYLVFDPSFLMERMDACYRGSLRRDSRYLCRNFRTVTVAPDGSVVHCRKIRKPFGNILDAPLRRIWNSELARDFRRFLLSNNLTALCENCPSLIPSQ